MEIVIVFYGGGKGCEGGYRQWGGYCREEFRSSLGRGMRILRLVRGEVGWWEFAA